jgi:hypothetical protein
VVPGLAHIPVPSVCLSFPVKIAVTLEDAHHTQHMCFSCDQTQQC